MGRQGGVDLDAIIAEISGLAGSRRYGIFRLIRHSIVRVDKLDSTLEPGINDFVCKALADMASDFSEKLWSGGVPFSWKFAPAGAEAADIGYRITDFMFHVFFRRCCAAERMVYVCQSRAGAVALEDRVLFYGHGLAQAAFDAVLQRPVPRAEASSRITTRERECLRWCAEGKTSEEIGIILSLSTHTVNHYLISATKKLNAVNRMHAITVAIRQGMLDINEQP